MKQFPNFLGFTLFIMLIACEDSDPITPIENEEKPRLLASYVDTYEIPGLEFQPRQEVVYEYDSVDRVAYFTVSSYDPEADTLRELNHFVFTYAGDKLHRLEGYLPGATQPFIEYQYHYQANGAVSIISEENHNAGLTSEARFTYSENGDSTWSRIPIRMAAALNI